MSDHDDLTPEPSFDDPSFDDLRRLLAEARVDEPVPADVAARLDATLESLRVGRATERDDRSNVVPLRQRIGRALVAAAAVVVVGAGGFGIVQGTLHAGGSSDDKASSGAGIAADRDAGSGTSGYAPEATAGRSVAALSTTTFARDAARLMRADLVVRGTKDYSAQTPSVPAPTSDPTDSLGSKSAPSAPPVTATPETEAHLLQDLSTCPGPEAAGSVTLPATLDGAPVALVFRPPGATDQRVEAWSCDGGTLLASALIRH